MVTGAKITVILAAFLICVGAPSARAQSGDNSPIFFNVLVIDVNKLINQSNVGQALKAQHEKAKFSLDNEFDNLKKELISKEQRLSKIRTDTDVAEFRQMAKEFDQRSTEVREAYIERQKNIDLVFNLSRRKLFEASVPYLKQILNKNNASVLIRKDQTVLSANSVDVTEIAINTINENLNTNAFLEAN